MPLPQPILIATERLTLRPVTAEDSEDLHVCYGDEDCLRYWDAPPHRSVQETRDFVKRCLANPALRIWAITETGGEDAGRALGWVLLRDVRSGVADIGYSLRRDRWGRGYAREAARAVVDHGFGPLGLRRIGAETAVDNAASIAVLEHLGFALEGRVRAARLIAGRPHDSALYGLLAGEARGD